MSFPTLRFQRVEENFLGVIVDHERRNAQDVVFQVDEEESASIAYLEIDPNPGSQFRRNLAPFVTL